ncbi:hypothetical protein FALCPG4_018489 [Fusarium falciforme]
MDIALSLLHLHLDLSFFKGLVTGFVLCLVCVLRSPRTHCRILDDKARTPLRPRSRALEEGRPVAPNNHVAPTDRLAPPEYSAPVDHTTPVGHATASVAPDGKEPRDSDNLVYVPHPPDGFRVIRFTVGPVNQGAESPLDSQPIELCFHSDFEAYVLRLLSLHFNDTYLMSYKSRRR